MNEIEEHIKNNNEFPNDGSMYVLALLMMAFAMNADTVFTKEDNQESDILEGETNEENNVC